MATDKLTIRGLRIPDDISGIVWVHCSLIDKWWKERDKGIEASYEDLTPLERWWHGGCWLTEEYALPYERWLNETVGISYVAEVEMEKGRKIVGHCDLVFSEEPSPWGMIAQLEILAIHREYQGRGIGTALVQHTMKAAKEMGYPHYVVFAGEGEIPFYRRQGLVALQNFCSFEIETTKVPSPVEYRNICDLYDKDYSEICDYLLVTRPSGDLAARYIWAKKRAIDLPGFGHPNFLGKLGLSFGGDRLEIVLSIDGWVEIWIPPGQSDNNFLILEALKIAGDICRKKGVSKLSTWLPQDMAPLVESWGARRVYSSTILHKFA